VTSPIRRYGDFAAHRQIKAFLRGAPLPFSTGSGTDIAEVARSGVSTCKEVSRWEEDHWKREFFVRNAGAVESAVVLTSEQDGSTQKVLLVNLGIVSDYLGPGMPLGTEAALTLTESGAVI
jgi:exoribonuclease-2